MTSGSNPRRIEPDFRTKVWGCSRTGPWFDCAYALEHENSRGKTEMWHILRADPGARIALGFQQPIAREELIPAAESGKIMDLLHWIEVQAGDTYFVPAGTVHAIGAGVALCEVQQNSDVTYRLYDYNRVGRELHLSQAKDVAQLGRHPGRSIPQDLGKGLQLLVECPYFRTYRAVVEQSGEIAGAPDSRYMVVLDGSGLVNGLPAAPGNVFDAGRTVRWWVEPETGSMTLLLASESPQP
jgi:mannose-6-phosphate isomerase